ncbi:LytTR family DNA-binding domain-containing protein [Histidinibacterium aquaticum]|nr:LytTR family DNA-binding domain-containing protein [Histidinibacterium aquaticum]
MSDPQVAAALGGVGVILGIAGPFGTDDVLRPLPRVAYWLAVAVVTYGLGVLADLVISRPLRLRGWPSWARIALDGVVTGLLASAAVTLITLAALGNPPARGREWAGFIAAVILISMTISAVGAVRRGRRKESDSGAPALLGRLPVAKRGSILALSAEDHYVRVRTTKGDALILMRLADAIAETSPVEGLRIHRSHWVALGAVAGVTRRGDGAEITLPTGETVPVSRANMAGLREKGLL